MLKRFPHAALWRWLRSGLFGFRVCDINGTLPKRGANECGAESCFIPLTVVHGEGQFVIRK
jgi:hypothetical protein